MGGAEEMNTTMINQDMASRMEEETLSKTGDADEDKGGIVAGTKRRDTYMEHGAGGTYATQTAYHDGHGRRGLWGDETWRHDNAHGQNHAKADRLYLLHFR